MYPDYVSEIDNDIKQLCNELIEKNILTELCCEILETIRGEGE